MTTEQTLTPAQRSFRASLAADASWGRTLDRSARTEPARKKFEERWLALAGGDPVRAESLRRAYFKQLAWKSAKARKRRGPTSRGDETGPR